MADEALRMRASTQLGKRNRGIADAGKADPRLEVCRRASKSPSPPCNISRCSSVPGESVHAQRTETDVPTTVSGHTSAAHLARPAEPTVDQTGPNPNAKRGAGDPDGGSRSAACAGPQWCVPPETRSRPPSLSRSSERSNASDRTADALHGSGYDSRVSDAAACGSKGPGRHNSSRDTGGAACGGDTRGASTSSGARQLPGPSSGLIAASSVSLGTASATTPNPASMEQPFLPARSNSQAGTCSRNSASAYYGYQQTHCPPGEGIPYGGMPGVRIHGLGRMRLQEPYPWGRGEYPAYTGPWHARSSSASQGGTVPQTCQPGAFRHGPHSLQQADAQAPHPPPACRPASPRLSSSCPAATTQQLPPARDPQQQQQYRPEGCALSPRIQRGWTPASMPSVTGQPPTAAAGAHPRPPLPQPHAAVWQQLDGEPGPCGPMHPSLYWTLAYDREWQLQQWHHRQQQQQDAELQRQRREQLLQQPCWGQAGVRHGGGDGGCKPPAAQAHGAQHGGYEASWGRAGSSAAAGGDNGGAAALAPHLSTTPPPAPASARGAGPAADARTPVAISVAYRSFLHDGGADCGQEIAAEMAQEGAGSWVVSTIADAEDAERMKRWLLTRIR